MKSNGDDTAPPLATVICSVPAFATSPKNIVAVSLDEETNEVARPLPLTRTCAPATKFAPSTVSVNELVPAIASEGLSDRMTGVVTANAFAATRRNASSKVERKVVTPHPQGITDTYFTAQPSTKGAGEFFTVESLPLSDAKSRSTSLRGSRRLLVVVRDDPQVAAPQT